MCVISGAIARTALCAWVDAIIIPSRGSALINEDAIKTSAGALLTLPICRSHNLKSTLDYLKDSGLQIIACSENADKSLSDVVMTGPTAIIMGSEEEGVSPEYLKKSDFTVGIPQSGRLDSFNVSVAAGIMVYEAARQRGFN
jgi:23S rRNA (guanosine2251-2'-O)-methyltransferase